MANEEQRSYWNGEAGRKWAEKDGMMSAMLQPIAAALLDAVDLSRCRRLLDVGCGGGSETLLLAESVPGAEQIVGVDISAPLLELARARRAGSPTADRIDFIEADAATHPFAAGHFDGLFSRFGVMFFDDPVAAFRNLHKALTPRAALAFCCWQALDRNPWVALPLEAALRHLPPPPPPEPGAPGPFAFANAGRIRQILEGAGFTDIEIAPREVAMCWTQGLPLDDSAREMLNIGPVGRLLAECDEPLRERVYRSATEALARALNSAGCRVIVAEPFRWHLCRVSRAVSACYRVTAPNTDRDGYRRELLAIIEREQVDLLFPVSEEALHVAALADELPPHCRLFSAPLGTLLELHDKLRFARLAREHGLAVPDTELADSAAGRALCAGGASVAKPSHACSGIGLQFLAAGEQPAEGGAGLLVQRAVGGDHISTLSLLMGGKERARVAYRGTVFAGTVAICFERVEGHRAVDAWLDAFFAAQPGLDGFIAFDVIVDDAGTAWAIECNPRVTSGIHFLDTQSLGTALISDDPNAMPSPVTRASGTHFQWAYSPLTEAYRALFTPREFGRRMRELWRAADVVWSRRDPLPFLLMTPLSIEILWPALTSRQTLGEATQRDIAWFD
jgi:SAM-dependent methyltransferase